MEQSLFKPFKLAFTIMKYVGMWHDGKRSWTYTILGHFAIFFFVKSFTIQYFMYVIKAPSWEESIEVSGLAATELAHSFKFWNFYFKLNKILESVDTLTALLTFSADERWKSRDHLMSRIATEIKIHKVFWFTAWTTCFLSCLNPFTLHELPYKAWFPFDTTSSEVNFWLASIYTTIIAFPLSISDITLDMIPVIFLTFAIGLVEELAERLAQIGEEAEKAETSSNEDEKVEKELIKCIEIHNRIKKFVKEIEDNFSLAIFLQGFISSATLCASAFALSTVEMFQFKFSSSN
jgi:hypothetical protein